jgi:hypothetical protein
VLFAYVFAAITFVFLYLGLYELGFAPGPRLRPGPFPLDGPWSVGADLVVAAMAVLVAGWWVWGFVANAVGAPVSFGLVVVAVAVTFYAPFLAFRPAPLVFLVTWPVTTLVIRHHAIVRTLRFPKTSWRVWIALALAGVVLFGSYRVYHPLVGGDNGDGSVDLSNKGWADLTITHVNGGEIGSGWPDRPKKLPYTVRSRSHTEVWSTTPSCDSVVTVTFSVLGRTATESFSVSDGQSVACGGF